MSKKTSRKWRSVDTEEQEKVAEQVVKVGHGSAKSGAGTGRRLVSTGNPFMAENSGWPGSRFVPVLH